MNDFTASATALLPRLAADRRDPAVVAELERLRRLWVAMSADERDQAAASAQALAATTTGIYDGPRDPDSIGLPGPATLTPGRASKRAARPASHDASSLDPAAQPLLHALRDWRNRARDDKPAPTVAHNSTLEAIAALRPAARAELAAIKGVGPAFIESHGADVLALVAQFAS